jgi:DNA-directed RNA polymerase II subunit RPB1
MEFTDRTLPHYPRYENGSESRGFITSNFVNGLNPQEFFFHAMSGREGVIDKAVKTANSGYLQRRLVKSMEDLKVAHDYSVRSSNNDVVQFCYGYDGFNAADLEKQKTRFLKINIDTLNKNYYIDHNEKFEYVMKSEIDKMKAVDGWKSIITKYNKKVESAIEDFHDIYAKFAKLEDIELYYPINFSRLIMNTTKQFKLDDVNKADIHPIEIINEINDLIEFCKVGGISNLSCEILLLDFLSPKILLRDRKFNRMAFMHLVNAIKSRYKYALSEGGEMVGPLAAQSFGEKTTQMTLKTFQSAGIAEKSTVTQGVTRLNELLSNTKNPKSNSCDVFLDEEHRFDRELAEKVANNLELTTIGDVLASTAVYLEPNNEYDSVLPEDKELLEIYKVFSELDPQAVQIPTNPWVIRLEFDRRKIIDKKITMEDINRILKINKPNASLIYTDDNASKLVFRMRMNFQSNPNRANDDIMFLEDQIKEIGSIIIKGVDGITGVGIQTDPKFMNQVIVKENGSFVPKSEYVISTDGTNLFDILIRKGVDSRRTFSIDPNEMYSIFGIEAARFQIQYQLNQLLAASSIALNPRHLDLLCDKMCQNGDIMSISRHGIKKENIGPLAKASFEETTDQLLEASLFGAFDNLKGVSSNIMVGQIPVCGTGDSTVLLDEDLLNTQEPIPEERDVDINQYFESSEFCEAGDIKFSLGDVNANDGEYDDYPDVMVV